MLTQTEAERLLDELSLEFGFRLPIHERQLLVADPPDDVARFTDAVFIAEGLSPSTADRRQYERVRDAVAKTFEGGDARAARAALALDARLPSHRIDIGIPVAGSRDMGMNRKPPVGILA